MTKEEFKALVEEHLQEFLAEYLRENLEIRISTGSTEGYIKVILCLNGDEISEALDWIIIR